LSSRGSQRGTANDASVAPRWLSDLLYEVKDHDPASFMAVAALFLVIGGAASSLPARRAATVDSVETLRAE
jgi:hypothetical protein